MSGRRDSNPLPTAWEAVALPGELLPLLKRWRSVYEIRNIFKTSCTISANAATATLHGSEFGTLEPGKAADIVIIDGDPTRDSGALLNVVTTIKAGQVVFEK